MPSAAAFNHAALVDLFFEELLAGAITGVRARPALTSDVHELYRAWCEAKGRPFLASVPRFVKLLQTRHGVRLVRKRYALGMRILGPHGVLLLAPVPAPRDGFEADWLGDHITSFSAALSHFRARVVTGDRAHAR